MSETLERKIDALQITLDLCMQDTKDVHRRITDMETKFQSLEKLITETNIQVSDIAERGKSLLDDAAPAIEKLMNNPMFKMLGGN